jgi:hypothetical protein
MRVLRWLLLSAGIAGISGRADVKPQYPTLPKHETPRFYGLGRSGDQAVRSLPSSTSISSRRPLSSQRQSPTFSRFSMSLMMCLMKSY